MSDAARPIAVETLLAERTWVRALARSLVLDDATADDVVQQTWLAALESPPREASALRGWLSRVVRNAASESRRRAKRRERWEAMTPPRPDEPSPAEVVAKADAHRRVVDAVMSLDEPYRAAVLLRFFEGLESDEVARRTGVPVETARTRIKRALALLRGRLDREHGGDGRAWALALVPLTGTKSAAASGAAGGAAVGVSIKTVVAASAASALVAVLATRATMTVPESDAPEAPPASSKDTASATRPTSGARRDAPRRSSSSAAAAADVTLARALDNVAVEMPMPGNGAIAGHVRLLLGAPAAGVVVRSYAAPDFAKPGSRSLEDEVRDVVRASRWRRATWRETTTDAEGAFSFADAPDSRHVVDASIDGCDVVPAWQFDPTNVRPGAKTDFLVSMTHVPITVLMPDATPATERVLIRFLNPPTEQRARPRDYGWTPDAPVAPVWPGTWRATAEIGADQKSQPVEFTTPVGTAVPSISLRLERVVPAAGAAPKDPRVMSALEWLKRRQAADGGWGDSTTTGAAVLSFLGAGETHQAGTFREPVKNGLKYLRDHQDAEGCLVDRTKPNWLRDHAVAALALVEAYAMTQSRVFKEPAQKGVAFALKSRTASSGWSRTPGGADLDIETTAWMTLLAKSAQLDGSAQAGELPIDKSVLDEVAAAIDRVTDRSTGRVVAANAGGTMSDEAATAVGVLARIYAGRTAKSDDLIVKGAAFLVTNPPAWGPRAAPDYAAWYFGTLAAFQVGEETWQKWNGALRYAVIDRQRGDGAGEDRGSWEAAGTEDADRVWATVFNTLCSEVYVRSSRVAGAK